ncbi:LOW QUALITY PROTEIN: STARD3 N-terminal-like protein [Balaenoptera musculus]|uniref:LOW QUALITY PROTEIN: STARD3 N-terminal-like protein n=1 Tax=Balaenoptera musculus TaxID=9771 RepID=A0A8B8Z5Q6_BALMU|nr:LOW QUALITY PROTEIN: STARD3 N-terminal-like protein [Balaenoptera musculus]
MNPLPEDMENVLMGSQSSHASLRDVHSINPTQLMARIESYEGREKKGISDVRRTFCLFVTFDLLFVTLLWVIELNVNGGIENTLEKEVVQYDYYSSYFDILFLAVFRSKVLILAYAVCRLHHWWAIALTTAVTSALLLAKVILSKLFCQGAFGYVLPIISSILTWIETWFLDFKVLPQEAEEENRLLRVQGAPERAALIPGGLSDGQFYSPPGSEARSENEAEEKQDSEKPLLEL